MACLHAQTTANLTRGMSPTVGPLKNTARKKFQKTTTSRKSLQWLSLTPSPQSRGMGWWGSVPETAPNHAQPLQSRQGQKPPCSICLLDLDRDSSEAALILNRGKQIHHALTTNIRERHCGKPRNSTWDCRALPERSCLNI